MALINLKYCISYALFAQVTQEKKKMTKLGKEEYEGKMLLKPYSKDNPDGVKVAPMGKVIVQIRKVENIPLPKTGKTWLMTFREYPDAALALNKTNLKMMVKLHGDDTDDWLKEKVALTVVRANNPQGKGEDATVDSLRIKAEDWTYGDDEGEETPDKDTGDSIEQPEEPDVEEEKTKKIQDRRKR